MFKGLGFRGLGFRGLGFRVFVGFEGFWGTESLGFRAMMYCCGSVSSFVA